MKGFKKKIFTMMLVCAVACMMFALPVMAASSSFSKSTVKLNAMNGGSSVTSSLSSGSTPSGASITQVKLALNVARGTDPYTLYVKSPNGVWHAYNGPTSSTTIYLSDFNNENPYGTWKFYIVNNGVSYNGNIYPTSTVTVSATVSYSY